MKTATVRDLRLHFPTVEGWLAEGEPVAITKSDILHVASAIILGAKKFASFDHRQRQLATATSLSLLPLALS